MVVMIHQPEYLPWIGFWNRLMKADVYVILDTATFQKHGFIHRNRVKTSNGGQWITVPLKDKSSFTPIKDLVIDHTKNWKESQEGVLRQSYRKTPYFEEVMQIVQKVFREDGEKIGDLDRQFFNEVARYLNISLRVLKASDLQAKGKGTDLLVQICKELGADTYLSGPGMREGKKAYMEPEKFGHAGIKLQIHEFEHPSYAQQFMEQGFLSHMCILDLLFNEGPQSREILEGKRL